MIHFLGEILLLILFTALLWFGIGWWVSSLERSKTLRTREEEWRHYLNTLRRDRDVFRDEVEKAHGRIRVLENRRADGQSPPRDGTASEAERRKYTQIIGELQEKYSATERKMQGYAQHVESLHQQNLEREDILVQLKKKLADTTRALHEREEKLEQLNTAVSGQAVDIQAHTAELQERVVAQEKIIAALKAREHSNEGARPASDLQETLRKQDFEIRQLRNQLDDAKQAANAKQTDADEFKQKAAELMNTVREKDATIAQLTADAIPSANPETEQEMGIMRAAMAEQEAIITQLRLVLDKATKLSGSVMPRQPGPTASGAPEAQQSGDLFADIGDGPAQPGSVELYTEPPEIRDNLKKINGIGPAFERILNRLGIYRFAQVAELSPMDIDWVAREIHSFPDRIVRDRWVEQARRLLNEHHDLSSGNGG